MSAIIGLKNNLILISLEYYILRITTWNIPTVEPVSAIVVVMSLTSSHWKTTGDDYE